MAFRIFWFWDLAENSAVSTEFTQPSIFYTYGSTPFPPLFGHYLYWARNNYFPWVAWNWVINLRFVHPQKAGERNFFHPVSRNPWEVIISGPVDDSVCNPQAERQYFFFTLTILFTGIRSCCQQWPTESWWCPARTTSPSSSGTPRRTRSSSRAWQAIRCAEISPDKSPKKCFLDVSQK